MSFISDLKTNCPNTYALLITAFCPPSSAEIAIKLEEDDITCCMDRDIIMNYLLPFLDMTAQKVDRFNEPADYLPANKWDAYKALINTAFSNLEA